MKEEGQRTMTADAMPEKWVNLEYIAYYLSVSNDAIRN